MNVRALQCFLKVYERKSVNAAAKEVFLSPQGLSKVIKQLEIDLEAELFTRGAQGMEATESGELLYARARHVCYLMEDIKKEIGIINGSAGALTVVVTHAAAAAVPLEVVFGFTAQHPTLQVRLKEVPDSRSLADLFEDEADVALVVGRPGLKNGTSQVLMPGRSVVVVGRDHPWAARAEVTLADLDGQALVLRPTEEGADHPVVEACAEAGAVPQVRYETGNLAAMHRLCAAAGFVALSSDLVEAASPDDRVKVLPLVGGPPEDVCLVVRPREIQSRAVALFQTYLTDQFQKRAAGARRSAR